MTDELVWQGAAQLSRAIARREVSAREVLDAHLAQIQRVNPVVNAIVTLDEHGARTAATEVDRQVAAGEVLGPLAGVPVTLKDSFEVAGMRSTSGDPALADHVPARDSDVAARLRAGGAVLLGKTNLPMHGAGHESVNRLFGATSTPWEEGRSSGGSSGGSAAAVASGMAALDVGGDNAGSLRVPCSWNGTFGHVTTYGTVSPRGVLGWATRFGVSDPPRDLAVLGPIARCAEDLDLALEVIAGPPADVARAWRLALPPAGDRALEDLRIGLWLDEPECPLDEAVRTPLEEAVAVLSDSGAAIEEARPDFDVHQMYRTYWAMLIGSEAHLIDEHGFRRARKAMREVFGPSDAGPLPWGAHAFSMYHREWLLAMVDRRRIEDRWAEFFERYDVLLCPAVPVEPITLTTEPDDVSEFERRAARRIIVNGTERDLYDLAFWSAVTILPGIPATVVPAGLTRRGLPTGLQVVGPRYADRETIRVAGLVADRIGGFLRPPLTRSVVA